MTAPLDLDAVRARAEEATPGPWRWNSYDDGYESVRCHGRLAEIAADGYRCTTAEPVYVIREDTDGR